MTEMEKELTLAVDKAVNEMGAQRPPLKAVEQPLSEQIGKIETIGRSIKERIRRELLTLQYEYLQATDKTRNDSERRLDEDLRRLTMDFNEKARELELLAKRLGA
jgi:SMC interacting uncharacterized protein involved in chromosome segregation